MILLELSFDGCSENKIGKQAQLKSFRS